ncbi:DUF2905 domain-containing protein [Sulfurimonas sp.]|uniref:DUF2905 domain-containing protein n=1 Tax=Sulfurimonas sp. TaxID=2022749 RepID=UPI00356357E4
MDKILIYSGLALLIIGLIWQFIPGAFSWIGNLPGDIKYKNENTSFYFPITTMIVISITLSLIFRFFGK